MDNPVETKQQLMSEETEKGFYEPAGRRGACSFVHNGRYCLHQGYTGGPALSVSPQQSLEVFDLHTAEWSTVNASNEPGEGEPETEEIQSSDHPKSISGACCTVINDCLYTFGGWLAGFRNADVHELNLSTMVWRHLEAQNRGDGPFLKDKAGMVAYGRHMVCVLGGYGYPGREHIIDGIYRGQKGAQYAWDLSSILDICWTNELHLFHIEQCVWISPEMTGTRPPPCAAFTLTKVDSHRVVLFGGRQFSERVNQLHILNMENWHWSGAIYPTRPEDPWPSKRSFHTACSLVDPRCVPTRTEAPVSPHQLGGRRFDWLPCQPPVLSWPEAEGSCGTLEPRLLVLWGMDNESDPINDAWILNPSSLTWKEVPLPECMHEGKVWHTMAAHHPTPCQAEVITFGGSPENLFANFELLISNVQATAVLRFGVSPLYQLCLELVAGLYEDYVPMLHCLPALVQRAVRDNHRKLCNLRNFTVAQL